MQDLPGTTSLRQSRPVSRRDALRYATAVSALAGLGAASVGFGTPAAAAAPQLIDFAMRQIPAQHIRAAGYSGVVNYVSLSRPGVVVWRQADHPALRRVTDRRGAGDRQQLPIRQARRDSTVGLHARVRRRRRRRSHRLAAAYRGRVAARVHRSSSPSTTTSTATPGTPSRCSGFAESTRCLECSAPASTEASMCASGPRRWRYREFEHARPPVGLADPSLVAPSDRPRRRSLPARGEHRVESRPAGRRDSKSTSTTSWPPIAASGTYIREVNR